MNKVYYNDNDPKICAWLRELIKAGLLSEGEIDERPIQEVQPGDLRGFTRCHFFAGIGGWDYALRLAGWPANRSVWTGSCPCQPFSAAGKQQGYTDPRHLWPDWFRLIRECRPAIVFGEQVEAAIRHGWLDLVLGNLEAEGYACGAVLLGAHSVCAPHIRQRVWWVAQSHDTERWSDVAGGDQRDRTDTGRSEADGQYGTGGTIDKLADSAWSRRREECALDGREPEGNREERVAAGSESGRDTGELALSQSEQYDRGGDTRRGWGEFTDDGGVAQSDRPNSGVPQLQRSGRQLQSATDAEVGELADAQSQFNRNWTPKAGWRSKSSDRGKFGGDWDWSLSPGQQLGCDPTDSSQLSEAVGSPPNVFWSPVQWLPCRDGKLRPVEPGLAPLAHGIPNRVVKLRGFGNAIVPQVTQAFIEAVMEC